MAMFGQNPDYALGRAYTPPNRGLRDEAYSRGEPRWLPNLPEQARAIEAWNQGEVQLPYKLPYGSQFAADEAQEHAQWDSIRRGLL